ncbi:MAG: thioredoxin [Lachnospiraceae bacterium]|nr:thioredoxin [Lachnospiraceae bacterium]
MAMQFNEDNFTAEVLQSDIPVLVDFYADWCGPCKMMAPVIDKLAAEFEGKIKLGKCNVDDNMALAEEYRVSSIPNMQIFKNGAVIDLIIGAQSENALRDRLSAAL